MRKTRCYLFPLNFADTPTHTHHMCPIHSDDLGPLFFLTTLEAMLLPTATWRRVLQFFQWLRVTNSGEEWPPKIGHEMGVCPIFDHTWRPEVFENLLNFESCRFFREGDVVWNTCWNNGQEFGFGNSPWLQQIYGAPLKMGRATTAQWRSKFEKRGHGRRSM